MERRVRNSAESPLTLVGSMMQQFGASLDFLHSEGWTNEQIWKAATGLEERPADMTASVGRSIIDLALQVYRVRPARRGPHMSRHWAHKGGGRTPCWACGRRTEEGELVDRYLPGVRFIM